MPFPFPTRRIVHSAKLDRGIDEVYDPRHQRLAEALERVSQLTRSQEYPSGCRNGRRCHEERDRGVSQTMTAHRNYARADATNRERQQQGPPASDAESNGDGHRQN